MPPSRGSSQSRDQTHLLGLLHWQTGSSPLLPPGNVGCGAHIIFRAAQSHIPLVLVLGTHPKARLLFSVLIMKGLTPLPKQAMKVSTYIDLEWLHALSAAVPDLLMVLLFFCMLSQSVMSDLLQPLCNQPGSLSMGFSRQEYWSGLPLPPLGDLLNPRIQIHVSCMLAGRLDYKSQLLFSVNRGPQRSADFSQ